MTTMQYNHHIQKLITATLLSSLSDEDKSEIVSILQNAYTAWRYCHRWNDNTETRHYDQ